MVFVAYSAQWSLSSKQVRKDWVPFEAFKVVRSVLLVPLQLRREALEVQGDMHEASISPELEVLLYDLYDRDLFFHLT